MISPSNTVKLLDKDCSHFKLNLNWSYKEEDIHRPRYISCTLTQNFPSTSWSTVFRSALVTRVCFGCFFQDEVDHTFAFGPVCPLLEVDQAKAPLWQGHWHSTIAFINPCLQSPKYEQLKKILTTQECPDVIWQQYFRGGKYEAAWWELIEKMDTE